MAPIDVKRNAKSQGVVRGVQSSAIIKTLLEPNLCIQQLFLAVPIEGRKRPEGVH
jgi:hypothetical protein